MKSKVVVQDLSQNNIHTQKKSAELIHIWHRNGIYKDVEHSTFVTIQSITIINSTERNGI